MYWIDKYRFSVWCHSIADSVSGEAMETHCGLSANMEGLTLVIPHGKALCNACALEQLKPFKVRGQTNNKQQREEIGMSMTRARYEELADKVYAFSGELLGNWLDVVMTINDDGIVGNPPEEFLKTFGQNEVTALLQETGISALELREWAQLQREKDQKELDAAVERTLADDRSSRK